MSDWLDGRDDFDADDDAHDESGPPSGRDDCDYGQGRDREPRQEREPLYEPKPMEIGEAHRIGLNLAAATGWGPEPEHFVDVHDGFFLMVPAEIIALLLPDEYEKPGSRWKPKRKKGK